MVRMLEPPNQWLPEHLASTARPSAVCGADDKTSRCSRSHLRCRVAPRSWIEAVDHSHFQKRDCSHCARLFAEGIMPETMEISDAAKSGDGTTTNVGIKMTGTFQCPECRQKFDSEKAKQLHWKFIHDPNRHQED
ncbi:unnamed protein product [Symbiodinium natans]|uniref:C2H2-type domain-containing protein n=1 Tax=Symbiodinium natans TaxID=878477 RepID=A0A812USW4_9DINO|nr:unnamed protein product [Symbiodinium natans]